MQTSTVTDKFLDRLERVSSLSGHLDDFNEIITFVRRIIEERHFFEETLNILDEGIVVIDGDERVILINQAAKSLLGVESKKHIIGESISKIVMDKNLKERIERFISTRTKRQKREIKTTYPSTRNLNILSLKTSLSSYREKVVIKKSLNSSSLNTMPESSCVNSIKTKTL